MAVYANVTGNNSLQHAPQATLNVTMREEPGQESVPKVSYVLTRASSAEASPAQGVSLAGLPEGTQWRLQGNPHDKGMLRNGLAYELGRIFFPDATPATKHCEVLFKKGKRYEYKGVYILAESLDDMFKKLAVRTGGPLGADGSIWVEYSPARDKMRHGQEKSGDTAVFGWSLHDRGFVTVYPSTGVSVTEEGRMEMAIDKLERTLESLTPGTYLEYMSLLDQQSAQDIFLLNTLLLNSGEGVSFFLNRRSNGRLRLFPTWNFEYAVDNTPLREHPLSFELPETSLTPPSALAKRIPVWRQLEDGRGIRGLYLYPVYEALGGDRFLWFDRLFLSKPFLMEMANRYASLRRGPLAPKQVNALVDALATRLGPALERDWYRWKEEYTSVAGPMALLPFTDGEGETRIRRTSSYDQELVKLRYSLREQDVFLTGQLAQMGWLSADLFDKTMDGNRSAGYALAVMAVFLIFTYMLTRKL